MAKRIYCDSGINWNWYLCGEFNDAERTVHVFFHERWHKWDTDRHPHHPSPETKSTGWRGFEMMEDAARVAYGVKVNGVEYLITNPGPVFEFRDLSVLDKELKLIEA